MLRSAPACVAAVAATGLAVIYLHRRRNRLATPSTSACEGRRGAQLPTLEVQEAPHPPTSLDDPLWEAVADEVRIDHYHSRSSAHRPDARCRALYDSEALYLRFTVDDRWVLARHTQTNSAVYQDSCAEFFFAPCPDVYINVETNCLGVSLVQRHSTSAPREGDAVAPAVVARHLSTAASLAGHLAVGSDGTIDPELPQRTRWRLGLTIPFAFVAEVAAAHGPRLPTPGSSLTGSGRVEWRCNFMKCADESSHPHWGAWADTGEPLNFHKPECFGRLLFV